MPVFPLSYTHTLMHMCMHAYTQRAREGVKGGGGRGGAGGGGEGERERGEREREGELRRTCETNLAGSTLISRLVGGENKVNGP